MVAGSGGRGDGVIVDAKSPSSANKADVSVAVGTESDETDSVEPCPCCPMSPVVMRGKARRSTARTVASIWLVDVACRRILKTLLDVDIYSETRHLRHRDKAI